MSQCGFNACQPISQGADLCVALSKKLPVATDFAFQALSLCTERFGSFLRYTPCGLDVRQRSALVSPCSLLSQADRPAQRIYVPREDLPRLLHLLPAFGNRSAQRFSFNEVLHRLALRIGQESVTFGNVTLEVFQCPRKLVDPCLRLAGRLPCLGDVAARAFEFLLLFATRLRKVLVGLLEGRSPNLPKPI